MTSPARDRETLYAIIAKGAYSAAVACAELLGDSQHLAMLRGVSMDEQIELVRFLLNHPADTIATVHDRWFWQRVREGWILGAEVDEIKKTHPMLVQHHQLPKSVREADYTFLLVSWRLFHGWSHVMGRAEFGTYAVSSVRGGDTVIEWGSLPERGE